MTVEDAAGVGGVGGAVAQALRDAGVTTPLRDFGIPRASSTTASRAGAGRIGLTAQDIARAVVEAAAGLTATQLEDWGTSPTG